MNGKQITKVYLTLFKEMGILDTIIKYNPIIAGGSVADLVRNNDIESINDCDWTQLFKNDIDIFVPGIYQEINSLNKESLIIIKLKNELDKISDIDIDTRYKSNDYHFRCTKARISENKEHDIVYSYPYPELNFIKLTDFKGNTSINYNCQSDFDNLLARFDFKCCQIGLMLTEDPNETLSDFKIVEGSEINIFNKIAELTDLGLKCNNFVGMLARLYKYKLKGFTISKINGPKLRALAAIQNINLYDILSDSLFNKLTKLDEYSIESPTYLKLYGNLGGYTLDELIKVICNE